MRTGNDEFTVFNTIYNRELPFKSAGSRNKLSLCRVSQCWCLTPTPDSEYKSTVDGAY